MDEQWVEVEAIRRLKARYFRLLDQKRWDDWGDVFTEDIVLDNTADGAGIVTGRDEVVAHVRAAVHEAITVHHGHMPEIEIVGPDSARGVWSMEDYLEYPNGFTLLGRGHYLEEYLKGDDGQWRIRRLELTRLVVHRSGALPGAVSEAGARNAIPSGPSCSEMDKKGNS